MMQPGRGARALRSRPDDAAGPGAKASASTASAAVVEAEPAAQTPPNKAVQEPDAATRGRELPQLVLPRPGTRHWNADDLDVPAFLRRQMD
jgi:hypothetical protein